MASIYFHIPFCKRLCGYCDFLRSVKLRYIPDVVEAMRAELAAQRDFLHDHTIRTIYFGGGTPSLLAPSVVESLIDEARALFDCSQLEEITIEVNPDDITSEYVAGLRQTSINRISIGVQSLDDECLHFMGRRHTAEQAEQAVRMLQEAGYDNISVDVIFGIDRFGIDALNKTLQGVLAMGVQHISAYHLTIEEGTRFGRMLSRGELQEVEEERSEAEFLQVHKMLTEAGYDHYEVSNYSLEGYRSRHNSSYWQGVEYLGIGVGAHSFNGEKRRWCEQSIEAYVNEVEYVEEQLSEQDRVNEYLMTALRCVEGFRLDDFEQKFGAERRKNLELQIAECSGDALVVEACDRVRIPPEKMLVSDFVIASLMV